MNWDSKNPLNSILALLKSKKFLIIINAWKFFTRLLDFKHMMRKCSPNFNSLSIVITKSLTVLDSQNLSLSILAHKCSNVWPEINRWHFSEFIFVYLFLNRLMAISEWFSYLISTNSKFLSQPYGVISSVKLHISQDKK